MKEKRSREKRLSMTLSVFGGVHFPKNMLAQKVRVDRNRLCQLLLCECRRRRHIHQAGLFDKTFPLLQILDEGLDDSIGIGHAKLGGGRVDSRDFGITVLFR